MVKALVCHAHVALASAVAACCTESFTNSFKFHSGSTSHNPEHMLWDVGRPSYPCLQGDITLEFTWIDASGAVHTSDRYSAEGKALAGGVGLIGIITEIKLQMTPPSNTKVISKNLLSDANIGQDVLNLVKVRGWQHCQCCFADRLHAAHC